MLYNGKRAIGILLVLALLIVSLLAGMNGFATAEETTDSKTLIADNIGSKDEVVYANLSNSGSLEDLYVVNVLNVGESGIATDHGIYTDVANLTDTTEIKNENGLVTVNTDPGKFYYEGFGGDYQIPWNISVSYNLDGRIVSSDELAGESGALEIHLVSTENETSDPEFYKNYMLQISISLDMDKASNINSGGGTEALSGSTKIINYTVLPDSDGDFTLTADVSDFEMTGIQISGIPYSIDFEMDELDDIMGQFDQLTEALNELEDGTSELSDGLSNTDNGLSSLEKGSSDFYSGLAELNKVTSILQTSSNSFENGLKTMSDSLNSSFDSGNITTMLNGLTSISMQLEAISSNISDIGNVMKEKYNDMPILPSDALEALSESGEPYADDILAYITAASIFIEESNYYAEELNNISIGINSISGSLSYITNQLGGLRSLATLQTGLSTLSNQFSVLNGYAQQYYTGVNDVVRNYGKINSSISDVSDGVNKLAEGSEELSGGVGLLASSVNDIPGQVQEKIDSLFGGGGDFDPRSFVSPENEDVNSVQFVMTTAGIEKEKVVKEEINSDTGKTSIIDRFLDLFR